MKDFLRTKGVWVVVIALALGLSACATTQQAQPTGPMSAKDLVEAAKKAGVKEITVEAAKAQIDSGNPLVILDVREPSEFKKGHLPKAINIPRGLLEFQVNKKIPDLGANIIVYCKTGGRSCLATETLNKMGYKKAVSMIGGWKAWLKAGYPVE